MLYRPWIWHIYKKRKKWGKGYTLKTHERAGVVLVKERKNFILCEAFFCFLPFLVSLEFKPSCARKILMQNNCVRTFFYLVQSLVSLSSLRLVATNSPYSSFFSSPPVALNICSKLPFSPMFICIHLVSSSCFEPSHQSAPDCMDNRQDSWELYSRTSLEASAGEGWSAL